MDFADNKESTILFPVFSAKLVKWAWLWQGGISLSKLYLIGMFICLHVFFIKPTFLLLYGKLFSQKPPQNIYLIFEVKHFELGEESSSFNNAILGDMELIYYIYFGQDGNYS